MPTTLEALLAGLGLEEDARAAALETLLREAVTAAQILSGEVTDEVRPHAALARRVLRAAPAEMAWGRLCG